MAREFEELIGKVSGQLSGLIESHQVQAHILQEHTKKIAHLETALDLKVREGDREHEQIRRRLEEGDKELQHLDKGKGNHSDRLERIEARMERAGSRRWDVTQIVISAIVGLVVSGLGSVVAWLLLLQKVAGAAAGKGGTP